MLIEDALASIIEGFGRILLLKSLNLKVRITLYVRVFIVCVVFIVYSLELLHFRLLSLII